MSDPADLVADFFDDGAWLAGTMGDLLAFLVDSGKDDAIYRIIGDEHDGSGGEFVRRLEVYLVPRKDGLRVARELGCDIVSKRVAAFWARERDKQAQTPGAEGEAK